MLRRLISRWQGVALSLIAIVATLWLGVTGQLGLYIHPRYFIFSMVMAVMGAVLVLAAFALTPSTDAEHTHPEPEGRAPKWLWPTGSVVVIIVAAVGLLVLSPQTLSTATVEKRDMNGSTAAFAEQDADALVGGDYAAFTVKDWASLLRQGVGDDYFSDKTANVSGFVTPDTDDPENIFFVARFVVTCCAVDAQPVGLPVYLPGWQETFEIDSWVEVTGEFESNPSALSAEPIVVLPAEIGPISRPEQPYVY